MDWTIDTPKIDLKTTKAKRQTNKNTNKNQQTVETTNWFKQNNHHYHLNTQIIILEDQFLSIPFYKFILFDAYIVQK